MREQFCEQVIVSTSVLRQAGKLPPELVEQHTKILASYGIVGQALCELMSLSNKDWMRMVDRIQNNERRDK